MLDAKSRTDRGTPRYLTDINNPTSGKAVCRICRAKVYLRHRSYGLLIMVYRLANFRLSGGTYRGEIGEVGGARFARLAARALADVAIDFAAARARLFYELLEFLFGDRRT